jgi:hypothetical protein
MNAILVAYVRAVLDRHSLYSPLKSNIEAHFPEHFADLPGEQFVILSDMEITRVHGLLSEPMGQSDLVLTMGLTPRLMEVCGISPECRAWLRERGHG